MQLAYMHLLEELKPKLAPPGLDLSDGQAVDIAVATLHEMLVLDKLEVVNPDRLAKALNNLHMRGIAKAIGEIVSALGHTDITVKWGLDGSINVHCDGGTVTLPHKLFARGDTEGELRAMRTGAEPS